MAFGSSGINAIVNAITSGFGITVLGELTISGYDVLSRYVQQDRDIGFLCHSPYTNSEEPAQSQHLRSRALSDAWSCSTGAEMHGVRTGLWRFKQICAAGS